MEGKVIFLYPPFALAPAWHYRGRGYNIVCRWTSSFGNLILQGKSPQMSQYSFFNEVCSHSSVLSPYSSVAVVGRGFLSASWRAGWPKFHCHVVPSESVGAKHKDIPTSTFTDDSLHLGKVSTAFLDISPSVFTLGLSGNMS